MTARCAVALIFVFGHVGSFSYGAYTVERLVTGLNQPMYVTQAPGDNSSLYIVERADANSELGRIRKYDLQTHTFSTFLDVTGLVVEEGGLVSMTFHPQYQTNHLLYVASNNTRMNRLDEYEVVSGIPQLRRALLQYPSLANVYHTINQASFRPNGDNNQLFVTTGDGGTQAGNPSFNPGLIESTTSPYGKILRVDLSQPFTSPASGPGSGVTVVASGMRNPYRAAFDRQTGDFFFGDVGFSTVEEVNFIPASYFATQNATPLNFGWTDREGTIETVAPYAGGPRSAADIDPILDYAHSGQPLAHPSLLNGSAVVGGYIYRGPVTEFVGQYFFSDFINGNVYSGVFDSSTAVASYNGTNLTQIINRTPLFEGLAGGGANIQFVTSFGEDNLGNLYIVKYGNSFAPSPGAGEIYRLSPVPSGVPGDYNENGIVDAADYIVWRKNVGTTSLLPNDPIGGQIGDSQYSEWRNHFGQSNQGGRAVAEVPEPATLTFMLLAVTWATGRRSTRWSS